MRTLTGTGMRKYGPALRILDNKNGRLTLSGRFLLLCLSFILVISSPPAYKEIIRSQFRYPLVLVFLCRARVPVFAPLASDTVWTPRPIGVVFQTMLQYLSLTRCDWNWRRPDFSRFLWLPLWPFCFLIWRASSCL